jgi:hypothetical protein
MVVTAIGQSPDVSFTEKSRTRLAELSTTRWNTIEVDPHTLQTNIPYLFAAGDAATGPALVVEAIGGGRRAARSIHQYVMNQEVTAEPGELGQDLIAETLFDQVEGIVKNKRAPMPEIQVAERIHSFIEVDQVLNEEAALGESNRCLFCCLTCYNWDIAYRCDSTVKDSIKESMGTDFDRSFQTEQGANSITMSASNQKMTTSKRDPKLGAPEAIKKVGLAK